MILVIVGPTAIGKSNVAIALAKQLHAEIISGDAYQFYQGMDIGTAKITVSEMSGIRHHLIDTLSIHDSFSVYDYQRIVRQKIDELTNQNIPVILVGGSGLYLQSVLYQYSFKGTHRDEALERDLELFSNQELYLKLSMLEPKLAASIHVNNRRRLLRAIQIALDPDYVYEQGKHIPYYDDFHLIGLKASKTLIYERIEQRIDQMIARGLIEEARWIYENGKSSQAAQAIGYKEWFPYFEGLANLEETIQTIKMNTRRYAKRQMTWFQNQMHVHWYDVSEQSFETLLNQILKSIAPSH